MSRGSIPPRTESQCRDKNDILVPERTTATASEIWRGCWVKGVWEILLVPDIGYYDTSAFSRVRVGLLGKKGLDWVVHLSSFDLMSNFA
jgi:hypothetical protein